ncbi:DUF2834 domain-containing protein [Loktanella sp. Alg231-35]|uniref:DUF2834 domain-containing protein n=1 Tax=Loktanella sp. Alg231-35 TaxID=1922220 RepID=UPI000D55BC8A|nr:DUF2834 domain-containing protein [Loktanella sp. Alg231-35]
MSDTVFKILVGTLGAVFALVFCIVVVPALLQSRDIVGAIAAGFVNPFSTGYSLDAIICAAILIVWIIYEKSALNIRHGWIAITLCAVPGVATAFAVYLLIRFKQVASR